MPNRKYRFNWTAMSVVVPGRDQNGIILDVLFDKLLTGVRRRALAPSSPEYTQFSAAEHDDLLDRSARIADPKQMERWPDDNGGWGSKPEVFSIAPLMRGR
jgi:hypothetical protein